MMNLYQLILVYGVLVPFVCYLLVVLYVYLFQSKLILNPESLPLSHVFRFDAPFQELMLKTKDGAELNCLYFKKEKSRGLVLYFHGKSRNLDDWASTYQDFLHNDFDVFYFDYRQFGKSSGRLSERNLHKDAFFIYEYVSKIYSKRKIILYGRSLGSGIAAKLARKVQPPILILETPYVSMREMVKRETWFLLPVDWILQYSIRTDLFLRKIKSNVYLFHGTNDEFIPFAHSQRLVKINSKRITLFAIEEGMHDNLNEFHDYRHSLATIFDRWYAKIEDEYKLNSL